MDDRDWRPERLRLHTAPRVTELAARMMLSPVRLTRRLRRFVSPTAPMQELRLAPAKRVLRAMRSA